MSKERSLRDLHVTGTSSRLSRSLPVPRVAPRGWQARSALREETYSILPKKIKEDSASSAITITQLFQRERSRDQPKSLLLQHSGVLWL